MSVVIVMVGMDWQRVGHVIGEYWVGLGYIEWVGHMWAMRLESKEPTKVVFV